jgi:hypothetical protein
LEDDADDGDDDEENMGLDVLAEGDAKCSSFRPAAMGNALGDTSSEGGECESAEEDGKGA